MRTSARASIVVPVAAAGLLAAGPCAVAAEVNAEYRELVERYARGQRAAAIAGLAQFSDLELGRIAQTVEAATVAAQRPRDGERGRTGASGGPEPPVPLRAAVMLHYDLDLAQRPESTETEQPRRCPGKQAVIAARYAALLAWHDDTRSFARRFFLALAHGCQWDACLSDAQRWAREGLKLFPGDAELLLAEGVALEESATIWGRPTAESVAMRAHQREVVREAAAERNRQYREAQSDFEDAITADEGLTLARVHLGRVLWRLGEREAARAALEKAAARAADRRTAHLAHLFLGRVYEDADRLAPAIEQYRRALAIDSSAQAAAVALSHALRLTGEAAEARDLLATALGWTGRRQAHDAYRDYLVGNAGEHREEFAALRHESLR